MGFNPTVLLYVNIKTLNANLFQYCPSPYTLSADKFSATRYVSHSKTLQFCLLLYSSIAQQTFTPITYQMDKMIAT